MPQFDKLTGSDNFPMWKLQMAAYLSVHKLMVIVDGTVQRPEEQKAKEQWDVNDALAKLAILTAIDAGQHEYVCSAKTSAVMWTNLLAVYERVDSTRKINVLREYHRYTFDGSIIAKHIARVENLAQQCDTVGETQSETNVLAKMLDGLPDRFNAVVTAWSVVPEKDQTRLTLKRMLLEAEARSTVTAETEQALAAFSKMAVKNSTKPGKDKKYKKDIECFKCHKKGHFARDCRYSFQKKNFDGSKSKKNNEESTSKKSTDGSSNSIGSSCFIVGSSESPEHSWIADSGASCHMVNDRSWFSDFISTESTLRLAGKGSLTAVGVGKVPIEKCVNGQWELAYLLNVLYVPGLRKNLFSVGAAARRGVTSYVNNGRMEFKRNGRLELEAVQADNNMFTLAIRKPINVEANVVTDLKIWHDRLGHASLKCIREMIATGMMPALKIDTNTQLFCESCMYGKMSKLPFEECERRAFAVGEMWHSDVNTMPVKSWGGHRYYVIFVDDKTGFRYVHFMKHKDEVLKNFIDMVKRVEIATGHKVKVLRSDNGGEYKNAKFKAFTTAKGIDHQFSAPHTPEQNGVAERDNRTVMEKALSMLLAKQMPKEAWAEAVLCTVYLVNRTPCRKTPGSSPFEKFFGKKPDLSHVRMFGSIAYELIDKKQRNKLQSRAHKRILVGYDSESSNYRLLDWTTKRISVSRHVKFDESSGPLDIDQHKKWPTEKINIPNEDESEENMQHSDDVQRPEDVQHPEEQHPEENVQRPEEDVQHPEDVQHSEEDEEDVYPEENVRRQLRDRAKLRPPDFYQCTVCCTELDEPQTYEEAMASNEVEQWRRAIEEEESALIKNNTWIKTKLPTGRKAITAKIIFKKKHDADGKVNRYKARLVVRGFSQRPGIDYNETYAPVIRYESIRLLFSLAAKEDFEIAQFDIKTAFLNGELDEEIFMQLPTGVTDAGSVVKLKKSLYGLKQSPRQWNKRFHQFLCKFNFISSEADRCVYKGNIEGERVLLALYVDDGLVMAKTQQAVEMVICYLQQEFEITLGDMKTYVGIEIKRDRKLKQIKLTQKNYLLRVAKRFNMEDAKGISTPMEAGKHLVINNNDTSARINVPYREAVGSLMFAACVTRPDIMFAVAVVSRYLEQPATEHWTAVKRIIRYAKETADYGIVYDGTTAEPLVIYSDSDFAADPDTRRSTSGYVTVHCGGPISWQSIRQKIVALSTTEAEYVAASDATKEVIWIQRLMESVGAAAVGHATELRLDNQGSIKLIKNPEFHKRTKHIDVRFHFIRDIYSKGNIIINYVPSSQQLADILTKALPRNKFEENRQNLQIIK